MLLTLYSASPRGLCCLMVVQSISHLANDLLQHITTGQNPVKIINLRIICVTLTKFNFHICFFLLIMVTDTVYIVLVAVYYFAVSP